MLVCSDTEETATVNLRLREEIDEGQLRVLHVYEGTCGNLFYFRGNTLKRCGMIKY